MKSAQRIAQITQGIVKITLRKNKSGEWILEDPTGLGLVDLKNGIIRMIGDPQTSFRRDPSRLLRVIYF